MVKIITVVCALLLFCTCASPPRNNTASVASVAGDRFLITPPWPGSLVIVGVSGRQFRRQTEIDNALEDAARKAAMYHGVKVIAESVQSIGSGIFDYYTNSSIKIEYNEELEFYMDKLAFNPDRDVARGSNGVFVRFTYPAVFPGRIGYSFWKTPDGRPSWINNPPREINGFIAGVGFSAKQFKYQDGFTKSRDSAVAAIVSQLSTTITTYTFSDVGQNTTVIKQRSEGFLAHFVILEIWIDPKNQDVWTLAIAQVAD